MGLGAAGLVWSEMRFSSIFRGTTFLFWARIFKLLRRSRIDSKKPIPPGCVAWRAGTTTLFYSVPSPHRLFKNTSTVWALFLLLPIALTFPHSVLNDLYRTRGFLTVAWFGSPLTPSHPIPSSSAAKHRNTEKEGQIADGRWGEGVEEEPNDSTRRNG